MGIFFPELDGVTMSIMDLGPLTVLCICRFGSELFQMVSPKQHSQEGWSYDATLFSFLYILK